MAVQSQNAVEHRPIATKRLTSADKHAAWRPSSRAPNVVPVNGTTLERKKSARQEYE